MTDGPKDPDRAAQVARGAREVLAHIAEAARRAGRDPAGVTLVAASKTVPVEDVLAAHAAGVRIFGENRVQEGQAKVPFVPQAEWHFIGRLQRNKARRAAELFRLIHSLDSLALGEALERLGAERGAPVEALVEVSLAGETSKGGVTPRELPALLRALAGREGLAIRGLMTIPPFFDDPGQARPYFRRLAALRDEVAGEGLPGIELRHLSMGMSGDFEAAIEEGATLVRVGTAIFGERRLVRESD